MTVPLISVVVPHLNQPDHLRRCLASLAEQTFDMGDVEIIVIDNGSEQLPSVICDAYDGVQLEQELEPGPGPARNKGVALSKGAILAFIDADCIGDRNWLATIADVLMKLDAPQIIGGDVRIAIANPVRLTMLEAYESIFAYRQQEYIEQQGFSGTGNLAMHRTAYEAVGPFAGIELAEDRDWGQRATREGYKINYVPGMIVFHPARRSFAELYAKWDRHIAHDFAEHLKASAGRFKWAVLTIAVAGSWLLDIRRIIFSSRLSGQWNRVLAIYLLIRIRLYRAYRMSKIMIKGAVGLSGAWNRL